jgi:cytochrome c-type biogenesis protein CcmE
VKTPELFALTKREQRIVIVAVLALLGGAVALHYRTLRSNAVPLKQPDSVSTPAALEDERPTPEEQQ